MEGIKGLLDKTFKNIKAKAKKAPYYFTIYDGLINKKHRNKIDITIWEFLWCVNRTTAEIERKGTTWGIVLYGRPISAEQIAEELGGSPYTIKTHLRRLANNGYIKLKRHPRGYVIWVKDSKRWLKRKEVK